jgi:hypothetical protein
MTTQQTNRWRPGRITGIIVGIEAAGLLLCASRMLIFGEIAFAWLGGIIVISWLVLFVRALFLTRMRLPRADLARWLAVPLAAILCLALVAVHAPFRVRFELSRSAFDQAKTELANGQSLPINITLGLLPIQDSWVDGDITFFVIPGSGFLDPCGVAYVRGDEHSGDYWLAGNLGDGWHIACWDAF